MLPAGVDPAAFEAFDMQALAADTFDAELAGAGDALAVVFFWGVDCFNCEIAKKAMLAQPDAIRALGLKWFHCNVYEHHGWGAASACTACRRGSSSTAASGSAARPAGMGSRSSRRRWRRRARRSPRRPATAAAPHDPATGGD
jgi:hypothetical protein